MDNIIDIKNANFKLDNSVTNIQYHSYNPYTTAFNQNDEIHIAIQNQDLYVLPHESYIYIEASFESIVTKPGEEPTHSLQFANSFISFLFDEIRYEINGFEVDRCKNVGITTLLKGICSYSKSETKCLQGASWEWMDRAVTPGQFNVCIPLNTLLGFCEDYKKIIMNAKHELILLRSRSNTNCFISAKETINIAVNKIQWRMPHVKVDDAMRLMLLKQIDRKQSITIPYRSWQLYEYPVLPQTSKHVWTVKTADSLNKPRYILLGFQTNRKNVITRSASDFDHCNISNVQIYLNSECYPRENMNLNFSRNHYSQLYQMYCKFQESYYQNSKKTHTHPYNTLTQFGSSPIFVFDCSRQEDSMKNSTIDVRIEIEASENIGANTSAYCLIINDNIVNYNPYTNIVQKAI